MRIVAVDAGRAAELRALARREPNARTRVRLLGVANVPCGTAMEMAARLSTPGQGATAARGWTAYARPAQERPPAAAHARAG